MDTLIISKPRAANKILIIGKQLDEKLKSIGSQLENLSSILKPVSCMVARHQFNKLAALQSKYLYLQQNITTSLMLAEFGLYDSIKVISPYNQNNIIQEAKRLEMQFMQFKNELFTKRKTIVIL